MLVEAVCYKKEQNVVLYVVFRFVKATTESSIFHTFSGI